MVESAAAAVDLFCGAGGLTFGLEAAGLAVSEGVDVDPLCRHPYEANTSARFLLMNVRDYTARDLTRAWADAETRILVGCAPCQPFSTYTQGPRGSYREEWVLLNKFSDLVVETTPEIVSMENVTPLQRTDAFQEFVRQLERAGYQVSHSIADCRNYGAPQMRRRLVLLASRLGPISLMDPTCPDEAAWRTVRDAIGNLAPIEAGGISSEDTLHRASTLSPLNMARMKASRPGGTWKDWPEELIAECHKKTSGKTYPGVYGRMEWDKPSPTITGQSFGFGNGRFGHPDQDRALSLREIALLQTFPLDYEFIRAGETPSMKGVGRMIGNAVPPLLGE